MAAPARKTPSDAASAFDASPTPLRPLPPVAPQPDPAPALAGSPRHAGGSPRWLRLPGTEQGLRYRWRRWRSLWPALCRPHALRPERCGHYASRAHTGAALRERFGALFDLRAAPADASAGASYPFLYAQGVIDLLQARVLADLGVNARHVWLLRHRTQIVAPDPSALAQPVQDLDCHMVRVVQTGPTEVVALLQTGIADEGGHLLAQIEDAFLVRGLAVAEVVQAAQDDLLRRAVSRMRRHTPEIDPGAAGVRQRQLYIAPAVGRHFTALGGGPLRLALGWRRGAQARATAVAPMLLRHLVARELAEWGIDQGRLQMTFLGRVAAGQTLQLRLQGRGFELIDASGRLAAFGRV